ncbi:MAG: SUMF1/EgtB/PvdO family nonheme iron enzyme [Polyangiaceae bacterium]
MMRKRHLTAIALICLWGCADGETRGSDHGSGASTSGGSGGMAAAPAGGEAGTAAAGQAGAGATGGTTAETCHGLPGPTMVQLASPGGVKYCMDRTEVTQAQYAEFLKQVKDTPGSEHADCTVDNKTYQPLEYPSSMEGADCIIGKHWTPEATPKRPVVCVDWCDAFAYCKWAGKRLCGKLGGGRVPWPPDEDPNAEAFRANDSQWYNACSQGGKTLYPYGDTYDPQACEGADVSKGGAGGWLPKRDVGARPDCHGTAEPFASIRDLSGSVREMTDECLWWQSRTSGSWECATRGGTAVSQSDDLSCTSYKIPALADPWTGFRCCKDLP